jgi:hypothetical protein
MDVRVDTRQMLAPADASLWTLIKPTNPAEFWTFALTMTTVALVVVAYWGLRSLGLTQSDMLTRAMRDARESAVARGEEFAEEIIPTNGKLLAAFAAAKMPIFVKEASEVAFDSEGEDRLRAARDWWSKLPSAVAYDAVMFLNSIEAWAMYFTNGLADETIAFGPCAPMYCSMIVQHYPILVVHRVGPSSGKYPNAIKLFKGWLVKLEEEKRGLRRGDLLKQLESLQAQAGARAEPLPEPLGTHIDQQG